MKKLLNKNIISNQIILDIRNTEKWMWKISLKTNISKEKSVFSNNKKVNKS